MKMILPAFLRNNIKVYAMNENATGDLDIKIYKSFSELPKVPKCAYIYLEKNEITPYISKMKAKRCAAGPVPQQAGRGAGRP